MKGAVRTLTDVEYFVKELIKESAAVHPDTDFHSYINIHTGERTYSDNEADTRNKLMTDSFEVCKSAGVDVCEFMMSISLRETGLDKFF